MDPDQDRKEPLLVVSSPAEGPTEAARMIDVYAAPIASILEPAEVIAPAAFRHAVLDAALEQEGVAGVLFAARWGGGGVMLT